MADLADDPSDVTCCQNAEVSSTHTDIGTGTEAYPLEAPASAALFDRAQAVIPGGVNSPVRAFKAVGGTPRFMVSAAGPWLVDADGPRS